MTGLAAIKGANLAAKFGLELCSLAAFGYWGAAVSDGAGGVVAGAAVPTAAALVWGRYAAPRSSRRLEPGRRIPLELSIFLLATAALWGRGARRAAVALAGAAAANTVLLSALDQWES